MFEIGVMLNNLQRDRIQAWSVPATLGFRVVHASGLPESWLTGSGHEIDAYIQAARASGLQIHTLFISFDGQSFADPLLAARTVGLADAAHRAHRLEVALKYVPVAVALGTQYLGLHVGRCSQDYNAIVDAVGILADHCASLGLGLNLETGQEHAASLCQFVEDVGRSNVGINFDPANFVMYGTDDSRAALEVLGPWVKGVHCKDALPAHSKGQMGGDVPLGQGVVDFRHLLRELRRIGYRGPLILEREHSSSTRADVERGRAYLQQLFVSIGA
jgi:sugar phosphate isomerase/epimerase